jgi:endonuclease-8
MDQRNCAGIGNVFKSEVLFIRRIHPCTAVGALTDADLEGLLAESVKWMRRNLVAGRRRTRWGARPNQWVYGKAGQRCGVCDGKITRIRQGRQNRSTYLCPTCQAAPRMEDRGQPSSLLRDY